MTRESDEEQEVEMDDSAGIEGRAGPVAARTCSPVEASAEQGRQSCTPSRAHSAGREE